MPLKAWVEKSIRQFAQSKENNLGDGKDEPAWGVPLIGFSNGSDPLYTALKDYVGPFHWTPQEIFSLAFPTYGIRPEELTVISWILPHTTATKNDNKNEKTFPSERWARAKVFGTAFDVKLRSYLEDIFRDAGYDAVVPRNMSAWEMKISDRYGYASTWSERHAAHISGLGTFGLCDGLITPAGKAMQCGSIIARVFITPTERPYTDHHEYCLYFTKGSCGKCIDRCPVGAISEKGHDKIKCGNHLRPHAEEYVKNHYGFEGYSCGLCQTGVPCQSGIPT